MSGMMQCVCRQDKSCHSCGSIVSVGRGKSGKKQTGVVLITCSILRLLGCISPSIVVVTNLILRIWEIGRQDTQFRRCIPYISFYLHSIWGFIPQEVYFIKVVIHKYEFLKVCFFLMEEK